MPTCVGDRLGPYEIVARLGEGGMGVVYRARDTRLGREVALKVIPLSRHGDPALRSRFEREAKALAALNHPHIAAIHDVIDVNDHRAIVMELVAGPTLAQLIARGPLPVRVAIGHGIDIANALSAAHAAGIVHRDLKPANIVITHSGTLKVLDFGIAKLATGPEGAAERATTAALTQDRAVIGTIGYMSPEQAHGHPADDRSDIFSLGVVLYEAISGQRAFSGDTTAAVLSALLRDDPPLLRTVVPTTPRTVERCVMRCIEKDPERRYQSATDLKMALEDMRDDLAMRESAHALSPDTRRAATTATIVRGIWPLMYAIVGLVIGGSVFIGTGALDPPPLVTPLYRPFITEVTSATSPRWSPDGKTLAYMDVVDGQQHIFVRGNDSSQSTQLTKEPSSAQPPFWAPDGSRIYFVRASDGNLVSVGAGGGEPQLVAGAASESRSALRHALKACISPDGRTIIFTRGQVGGAQLSTLDVASGNTRALEPTGMPRPLVTVAALAFSPDGTTLAIVASTTAANLPRGIWLVSWPGGSARHILDQVPYRGSGSSISWMPDNRRVVMAGYPLHGGPGRLLIADTSSGTLRQLTGGRDTETSPSVSPDGNRIAFVAERSGRDLIQFPVDGGPPESLLASSRAESFVDMSVSGLLAYVTDADGSPAVRVRSGSDSWSRAIGGASELERTAPPGEIRLSPDARRIAVSKSGEEHLIWIYPTAGGTPVRLDSESAEQHGPSWSPDGNWIAYRRLLNGNWSIVKAPLGGGAIVRLDDANPGGTATDWSPTGQWIAHSRPDGLHLVSADGGTPGRVLTGLHANLFRFSHDGSRLFAVRRGGNRRWELTMWDVAAGREWHVVGLPVASSADLQSLALSPDDTRIIVSVGTSTSDIWLLEQFEPSTPPWARWLRW